MLDDDLLSGEEIRDLLMKVNTKTIQSMEFSQLMKTTTCIEIYAHSANNEYRNNPNHQTALVQANRVLELLYEEMDGRLNIRGIN